MSETVREGEKDGDYVREEERERGRERERERERSYLHHSVTPSAMAMLQALHHLRVNVNPDALTNVKSTGAKVALLTKKGEVVTVKSTTLSISHSLQVRLQRTQIQT
jgi:hypothetical protein